MLPTPFYQDEATTLYHGDSYELLPFLPVPDLLLTDPPYKMAMGGGGIATNMKYVATIKDENLDKGFDMTILDRFPNWVCFCSKDQLKELLAATGDRRWMLVTWNKTASAPFVNGNYLPDTEYIVHAFQSGRLFGELRDKSRFIVHSSGSSGFDHPTVKPIAVVSKMVRLASEPGNLIIDPFAGSGTTLVAAKLLGRRAIGIERELKYCEIIKSRLQQDVMNL